MSFLVIFTYENVLKGQSPERRIIHISLPFLDRLAINF